MENQSTKTHEENYRLIGQMLYKKHGDDFIHVIDVPDEIKEIGAAIAWYQKRAVPEVKLINILYSVFSEHGFASISTARVLQSTDAIRSFTKNRGAYITQEQAHLIGAAGLEWVGKVESGADYYMHEVTEPEQGAIDRLDGMVASKLTYKSMEIKPMAKVRSESERLAALLSTFLETMPNEESEDRTLLLWATELAKQQASELKAHDEYIKAREQHDRELSNVLVMHGNTDRYSDIPF